MAATATQQIEYKVIEAYLYPDAAQLKALGDDGWVMCAMIDRTEPIRMIFWRYRCVS